MGRGGKREGAGRKKGVPSAATLRERLMYAKHLAAQARSSWRAAQQKARKKEGPAPGPAPSSDDLDAAVGYVVKLLTNAALRGDGRCAVHLDERLNGRVPVALQHGGPEGAPIAMAPQKHVHEIRYVDSPDLPDADGASLDSSSSPPRAAETAGPAPKGRGARHHRGVRAPVGQDDRSG